MADYPDPDLLRRIERLEFLTALALQQLRRHKRGGPLDREINSLLEDLSRRAVESAIPHSIASIQKQINFLQSEQADLKAQVQEDKNAFSVRLNELSRSIEEIKQKHNALSADTHQWLAAQSLGIDTNDARLSRFIPLRAYLSESSDRIDEVSREITDLVEAFGFQIADDFPPTQGSWFKKWWVKTAEVASQPEVAERLAKIERALELKGLGQPQAEIDAKQADAVSKLIKTTKDFPNVAMQIGSILFIKVTKDCQPMIQVKTLTQNELIYLESNQNLLASPSTVLDRLAEMARDASAFSTNLDEEGHGIPVSAPETTATETHARHSLPSSPKNRHGAVERKRPSPP